VKDETGASRCSITTQDIKLQPDTFRDITGQFADQKVDFRDLPGFDLVCLLEDNRQDAFSDREFMHETTETIL